LIKVMFNQAELQKILQEVGRL